MALWPAKKTDSNNSTGFYIYCNVNNLGMHFALLTKVNLFTQKEFDDSNLPSVFYYIDSSKKGQEWKGKRLIATKGDTKSLYANFLATPTAFEIYFFKRAKKTLTFKVGSETSATSFVFSTKGFDSAFKKVNECKDK